MDGISVDLFDLLSNEIVTVIFSYLDLVSLYRLAASSHRLEAFKTISNDQWRRYYAQRWFVEDKELAICEIINWQSVYYQRLKSERDYLSWLQSDPTASISGPDQLQENQDVTQQPPPLFRTAILDGKEGVFYAANTDPWAALLKSNFQLAPVNSGTITLIDKFFDDLNFTEEDAQREVASGRFEILVSAISKGAANDLRVLNHLDVFRSYFVAITELPEEDKSRIKLPFGLVGLLAKYMDPSLPLDLLSLVATILWTASGGPGISEDLFVGLDLVSKTSNVFLKTTDAELKHSCLSILTWFNPEKPENQKALANPTFMRALLEQIDEKHLTLGEDLRWHLRLLSIGGGFNLPVVKENRTIAKLLQYSRENSNDPLAVSFIFSAIRDLCIDLDEFSDEILQDDTALDYIMSWIKVTEDVMYKKAAKRALGVLDILTEIENGVDELLERGTVDFLLPFMDDPNNTHLFNDIYGTLRTLTRHANNNGFGDEIFAKLLKHKDALLNRGYESGSAKLREACDSFWMTFSCATAPPRDVSIILIDRALPTVLGETKLNVKKDAGLLLANLAEIDDEALVGKDLIELFNYLAEYLINFDGPKEAAELSRLEQEQDGKRALISAAEEETEKTQHVPEEEEGEEFEESEEDEEIEDEDDDKTQSECPWPLNVLAQIVRIDNLKPLAIQNERFMDKLFALCTDESFDYETHFLVMYVFSQLIQVPGWDSEAALEHMEHFSIEAEYDVEWNYAFAKVQPYAHLLQKNNPTPMTILGSWFLAHMSTTEPGRNTLKKELDPSVLKWMKNYSHPRVEYNMGQFDKNMKKKARKGK